jgi:hypothetical protein
MTTPKDTGEATARPWAISGATIIWSPTGRSNVAAVSDPRPPNSSSVGYYEIEPWGDGEDADHRFREACANAELIVTAVNERDSLLERVRVLEGALRPLVSRLIKMMENGSECDCPAEGHLCGWSVLNYEVDVARAALAAKGE